MSETYFRRGRYEKVALGQGNLSRRLLATGADSCSPRWSSRPAPGAWRTPTPRNSSAIVFRGVRVCRRESQGKPPPG